MGNSSSTNIDRILPGECRWGFFGREMQFRQKCVFQPLLSSPLFPDISPKKIFGSFSFSVFRFCEKCHEFSNQQLRINSDQWIVEIYIFLHSRTYLQFEIVFLLLLLENRRMNCFSPRKNLNLADTDEWSEWIGEISIHLFCKDYHYYEWWKLLWNSWKDAKLCKLSSYLRMVRTFFSDFRSSFKCC